MSAAPSQRTVVLSIPLDRCVKHVLDTPLFAALQEKYRVCIVSYLSDDDHFQRAYGGKNVEFMSAPRFGSPARAMTFNVAEIFRFFGYYYRWRKSFLKSYWSGYRYYKYPQDYVAGHVPTPRRWRAFRIGSIAALGYLTRAYKWMPKLFGRAYLHVPALDEWFRARKPVAYIATAHRTDQEKILSYHARRHGVRSVILPDSWDNFAVDGFQFHDFDAYASMGPAMNEQLREYHGVGHGRIVPLGMPMRRMYEQQLAERRDYSLRQRFTIPAELPIITYIAVSKAACYDTLDLVRAIAQAIDRGELPKAVVLVRTQPGEDPTDFQRAFASDPWVRVQVGGTRGGGGNNPIDFSRDDENIEYAATIHEAAVVVSGVTACILDACVMDVPFVVNAVELQAYPRGGFSPAAAVDVDIFGLVRAGAVVARTTKELIDAIGVELTDRARGRGTRVTIGQQWDYQQQDYVQRFLRAIEPDARRTPTKDVASLAGSPT